MRPYLEELKSIQGEMKAMRRAAQNRLRSSLSGNLHIYKTKRGLVYCRITKSGDGTSVKYIGKNKQLVYKLAHKAYDTELLRRVTLNANALESCLKTMLPFEPEDVLAALPRNFEVLDSRLIMNPALGETGARTMNPVSREIARPQGLTTFADPGAAEAWRSMPYCENGLFPENKRHLSQSGYYVRSKSEAAILDIYMEKGIPVHYDECFLLKSGELISPDFIALRPCGSFFIHEHLGRMDLDEYQDRFYEKLARYRAAGFIPGINLLLTFDDPAGGINLQLISAQIEDMYSKDF